MNKAISKLIEKDSTLLDKSMIPNIGKRYNGSSFLPNLEKQKNQPMCIEMKFTLT